MPPPTPFIKKCVIGLCIFRFAIGIMHAALPLDEPHVWRQTDTLGTSLRYWQRMTIETAPSHLPLPAILNSGDTDGVMPMEFPLLNVLTSPGFFFSPPWGKVAAHEILILLLLALTIANARIWRSVTLFGGSLEIPMWLLPAFSVAQEYSIQFMPDYFSMSLVLMAVGLSWNRLSKWSLVLATLGLLVKPTSIVIFALYLLHPRKKEILKRNALWTLLAIGVALTYYVLGTAYIKQFQETTNAFELRLKNPLEAVYGFLSLPKELLRLFGEKLFSPILSPLLWITVLWFSWKKKFVPWQSVWVMFLQTLVIAALGGPLTYKHIYYFIALTPLAAVIFVFILQQLPKQMVLIFFLVLLARVLEVSYFNLRFLLDRHEVFLAAEAQKECPDLINKHPEFPWRKGLVFRSSPEPYPELGVCFQEREGSKVSEFGFFWQNTLPQACHAVDQSKNIVLARCSLNQ